MIKDHDSSVARIRRACKRLWAMSLAEKIPIMVKAKCMTAEQAETALRRLAEMEGEPMTDDEKIAEDADGKRARERVIEKYPPASPAKLRPKLREAMDASWERSKEACRYLAESEAKDLEEIPAVGGAHFRPKPFRPDADKVKNVPRDDLGRHLLLLFFLHPKVHEKFASWGKTIDDVGMKLGQVDHYTKIGLLMEIEELLEIPEDFRHLEERSC